MALKNQSYSQVLINYLHQMARFYLWLSKIKHSCSQSPLWINPKRQNSIKTLTLLCSKISEKCLNAIFGILYFKARLLASQMVRACDLFQCVLNFLYFEDVFNDIYVCFDSNMILWTEGDLIEKIHFYEFSFKIIKFRIFIWMALLLIQNINPKRFNVGQISFQ